MIPSQGTITLDWGIIFDTLAIIETKNAIRNINNDDDKTHIKLWNAIASQIGIRLLEKIVKSKEYKELVKVNLETFKLVDLAQKDDGLAKKVDVSNHLRYIKKVELQKKFFGTEASEIKLGYDK